MLHTAEAQHCRLLLQPPVIHHTTDALRSAPANLNVTLGRHRRTSGERSETGGGLHERKKEKKKAVAEAYFVEVMEAERQAHHEDGEGAVVPPSVGGRSCSDRGKK